MKRLKNAVKVMDLGKVDGDAIILARTSPEEITQDQIQNIIARNEVAKVKRPGLFAFLTEGGWNDLDIVPAGAIKMRKSGFKVAVLPSGDDGRAFSAESVRLWIYQHITGANNTDEIRAARRTHSFYVGKTG